MRFLEILTLSELSFNCFMKYLHKTRKHWALPGHSQSRYMHSLSSERVANNLSWVGVCTEPTSSEKQRGGSLQIDPINDKFILLFFITSWKWQKLSRCEKLLCIRFCQVQAFSFCHPNFLSFTGKIARIFVPTLKSEKRFHCKIED